MRELVVTTVILAPGARGRGGGLNSASCPHFVGRIGRIERIPGGLILCTGAVDQSTWPLQKWLWWHEEPLWRARSVLGGPAEF